MKRGLGNLIQLISYSSHLAVEINRAYWTNQSKKNLLKLTKSHAKILKRIIKLIEGV